MQTVAEPVQEARREETKQEARREETKLDRRYGKIGISALLAALPYQTEAKNPEYAPAVPSIIPSDAA